MSQNEKSASDLSGVKANPPGHSATTPSAEPAQAQSIPEGLNAGQQNPSPTPAPAPATTEQKAIAPVNDYIPGGMNKEIMNPVKNPNPTDLNTPFSTGHKMHEVAQTQDLFTYPLDTYYGVFDAISYFSDEKNRNRYNYEQQQAIISRIVRAAQVFDIPIEGIRDRLMN